MSLRHIRHLSIVHSALCRPRILKLETAPACKEAPVFLTADYTPAAKVDPSAFVVDDRVDAGGW